MSCEHEIKLIVAPTDEACKFHVDVSAYKDRIVAPDEYSGATVATPSDTEQVLPTKDRLVRDDITVNPAPTEILSTDHNGTFTPSEGHVGFSQVDVDVQPDLRPLSVSENGEYQPDGFDGFSQVDVNVEQLGVLIKTVTVSEDHNPGYSDDPFYWYTYLELGAGIFIVFFDDNEYRNDPNNSAKAVDMICFITSPNASKKTCCFASERYSEVRSSTNSFVWASAGTKIRVYQIPYNL